MPESHEQDEAAAVDAAGSESAPEAGAEDGATQVVETVEHEDHDDHDHDGHGDPDPEILVSPITKAIVALLVTTVVFAVLMIPLVRAFDERVEARVAPEDVVEPARPSGPLLQPHPPTDMEKLREQENATLGTYGWSDEASGVARVPLSRAQELVLAEGLGPVVRPVEEVVP
ncbi:MAG: hypothetical protein AAGK22_03900 [Acidobacteriota bacterium]